MHELYVEQRDLDGEGSVSWDIAHHMYSRQIRGTIAVVAKEPFVLMRTVKKQWLRVYRQVQRERSSTLDATRILELTHQLAYMQNLSFTSKPPHDLLEADVTFATAEDFVAIPPICHTMYVTYEVSKEQLHMMTAWMPKKGVVVMYTR
ncbi:MAG TPA: hypothetical protein VLF60_03315 [Candidatus Saccharimonadales bacterium]|nr:hypothetical protein [Candidatus Saccharimonadales bacterium]